MSVVSEQPRVEGAGEGNRKKNTNWNRNQNRRRVLRDIGNMVTIEPQISIGIPTRATKAQVENNNKCKTENVNVRVKKEASVKKGSKTLTSILTARSKAVHKDIDAADLHDELAAVEYVEDIYNFYKQTEEDGRVDDYMGSQPEISSTMRAILVDWLIEVHNKFDLMPESLYLTVNIMDRYLALKPVSKRDLQLVGISSMLIACKYEEIWAPEVRELVKISAYAGEQILAMEKSILGKLHWCLTVPTPYVFLVRFIKAADDDDKEMEKMAFFYAELGLMSYSAVVRYSPSQLSAAAVYAARRTLERSPFWTCTLQHYTAYSEDRLLECGRMLVRLATENKVKAVYGKYSNPDRQPVALF